MEVLTELLRVRVARHSLEHYKALGYRIPLGKYPFLMVKPEDIPPASKANYLHVVCGKCGKMFHKNIDSFTRRKSDHCKKCAASERRKSIARRAGKSRGVIIKRLIKENPYAICDISGETNKLFLVVHHLTSLSNGGSNEDSNFVVITANYHKAFHMLYGTKNTAEQYQDFKYKILMGEI